MYMFLVGILYVVYSVVVVDLLRRAVSCVVYVCVGKTCIILKMAHNLIISYI